LEFLASVIGLVAVTDYEWFEFLSAQPTLDEVNFWRPRDTRTPRQLQVGAPIFFKLKREHGDRIVGFGIFARHEVLPAYVAWDWFDTKNGAPDFPSMRKRIERLSHEKERREDILGSYQIGCLMLSQPLFFEKPDWIAPPNNWPPNAVQGKAYDLQEGEGARIWAECRARAVKYSESPGIASAASPAGPRYGEPVLVRPRMGQGLFRATVTDAYGRACAVTGEHSLPALEAAHIQPYGEGGEHEVSNGLLLRSDLHRLFDRGYVAVTHEYRFVVSGHLKNDFDNGRSYYPLHGNTIRLPETPADRPNLQLLEWHLAKRFRG
jgi:putative restriction endonuclease